MNRYMHPDEIEELEHQTNGYADYLSEAFGGEARLLQAQMEDDIAQAAGFTGSGPMRLEADRWNAKRRAADSIRESKALVMPVHPDNDVPF